MTSALQKKILGLLLFLPLFATMAVSPVYGQARDLKADVTGQLSAGGGDQGAGFGTPVDPRVIIAKTIQIILSLLGTIFVVLIVYGGFQYFTARGDDDKAKKAMHLMQGAVVGFIIILISYSITTFVLTKILAAVEQGARTPR